MVKVANDGQLFWDFDSLVLISEVFAADLRWTVYCSCRRSSFVRVARAYDNNDFDLAQTLHERYSLFSAKAELAQTMYDDLYTLLTLDEQTQLWSLIGGKYSYD